MNIVDLFNAFEAAFWLILGGIALFGEKNSPYGRRRWQLAGTLAAFGASDLIELQTGAWWRPWWLLLLKATCLISFAWTGYSIWRDQKNNKTK